MNLRRISIILLHTWYHFTHSMETWVDLLWNPFLQMAVFAFISLYLVGNAGGHRGEFVVMGMIFWNVIWVGQYAMTLGVLWEIWSRSFSSLFITPLTLGEFLVGQIISGVIKSIIVLVVTALLGYVIYHFSIFQLGWYLVVYYVELYMFSLAMGMLVLGIILRFGVDVQSLSWALVFLVQPFGGVFYPVSVLPAAIRWVAYGLPSTYVFETMRQQIVTGTVQTEYLITATGLNIVYLVVMYGFLRAVYAQAKRSGAFARMEG